jgi:hypothetical protein
LPPWDDPIVDPVESQEIKELQKERMLGSFLRIKLAGMLKQCKYKKY